MGDLADDFNKHTYKGWECPNCEGSGIEVYEDPTSASGEGLPYLQRNWRNG